MKKNLLSLLFLESTGLAGSAEPELNLAESLERLLETAAEIEPSSLESKKTPLAKALGEFGISDTELQLDPEGFCLYTDNRERYNDVITMLGTPEAMHKLAEMGWVVTKPGDDAMTGEPANYRVRFLGITTVDTGDADKASEKIKAITQKAREFATTEMDRDDDLNPVEDDDGKMGKRQVGVGKAKDGADPEGTPKGAGKVKESALDEMTSTGSMGTVEGGPQGIVGAGIIKKPAPYGKGTKFAMPGQWKVKQPIVNKQVKRHPRSESFEDTGYDSPRDMFSRNMFGRDYLQLNGHEKMEIDGLMRTKGYPQAQMTHDPHIALHPKRLMGDPRGYPRSPLTVEDLVPCTCQHCNESFIYENQPEAQMGCVRCPHCTTLIDQQGKVLEALGGGMPDPESSAKEFLSEMPPGMPTIPQERELGLACDRLAREHYGKGFNELPEHQQTEIYNEAQGRGQGGSVFAPPSYLGMSTSQQEEWRRNNPEGIAGDDTSAADDFHRTHPEGVTYYPKKDE